MKLYPVQKVIIKAHYGIALDDTEKFAVTDWRRQVIGMMTEKEYLEYLYSQGRCNIKEVIPGQGRRKMVLAVGRRSGKTAMAACISAYETYKLILKGNPQAYYGLPPTNDIQLIAVATDKDQAGILYQGVSGHFRTCPFFGPYTANNTQSYARFQTPNDIEKYGAYSEDQGAKATIRVTFRSCIAKGLRGPGNIVIVLDEVAHFTDAGQSSADAVYDAVVPSSAAYSPKDPNDKMKSIGDVESRIVLISSPLGRQGLFYKMFQMGMGAEKRVSDEMFCLQAPTWEVNPSIAASELESNYLKDPRVFFTEFGAEFTDRTRGWLESADDLQQCIVPEARPVTQGIPRQAYFLGLDLGLVEDGTAVSIGHLDQEGKIVVDLMEQMKAGEGKFQNQDRLEFDDVADWVLDLSKKFYIAEGIFDQWAGIPFEQALKKRGLGQMKATPMTKIIASQMYQNFKDMMWDKRLALFDAPLDQGEAHCPYIKELLELQAEYHSKFVTIVSAPNIKGKHDDLSDALVRMVWLASNRLSRPGYFAKGTGYNQPPNQKKPMSPISRRRLMQSGSHESRQVPRMGKRFR